MGKQKIGGATDVQILSKRLYVAILKPSGNSNIEIRRKVGYMCEYAVSILISNTYFQRGGVQIS